MTHCDQYTTLTPCQIMSAYNASVHVYCTSEIVPLADVSKERFFITRNLGELENRSHINTSPSLYFPSSPSFYSFPLYLRSLSSACASLSLSHSLSHSISLTLSLSLSHSLSLTLSLSHTHTHTHTLSLSLSLSVCLEIVTVKNFHLKKFHVI